MERVADSFNKYFFIRKFRTIPFINLFYLGKDKKYVKIAFFISYSPSDRSNGFNIKIIFNEGTEKRKKHLSLPF